ncbi:ABC transporter permease [Solicola sp. PLA-1-18]|uniref:ABC transporter permease n=1 Tax=Solicola sp. PLA-1-18 TaxID=3380532 RepID=UPI003B784258
MSTTAAAPSALRLAWLHTRYQLTEVLRVPIAVVGNCLFPALALVFFVVPQDSVASDPLVATAAIGQLSVFAVMSTCMFTYGVGVAEDRERPFDGYLRSLPAGAVPQLVGRIATGMTFVVLALVPVVLIGWLATSATVTPARLGAGVVALVLAGLPFLFLGFGIGYLLTAKAALPIAQVVLFPMAFAGGIFLPPQMFPGWLDAVSLALPSRAGRDGVVWALVGGEATWRTVVVWAVWTAGAFALAVWAYRRDEGRRFH